MARLFSVFLFGLWASADLLDGDFKLLEILRFSYTSRCHEACRAAGPHTSPSIKPTTIRAHRTKAQP